MPGAKEKGKIKSGLGNLIGSAGEHYVMAELLKRGVIAALAPRNAPGFDILATNSSLGTRTGKTVKIRVKTKSGKYDTWQWLAKNDNQDGTKKTIFPYLDLSPSKADSAQCDDFTVLVDMTEDHREMSFYIVPTWLLNKWLVEIFMKWVSTPGAKGQQRDASNRKRTIGLKDYGNELAKYRDNWDCLWEDTLQARGLDDG